MGMKTYELTAAEQAWFRRQREVVAMAQGAMQGALQFLAEQQGFRGRVHLEDDRLLIQPEPAAEVSPVELFGVEKNGLA
jgi:hypothetical protein